MRKALLLLAVAVVAGALVAGGCGGGGGSSVSPLSTGPDPGRYVVFDSTRAGGAGFQDVYLYDRHTSSLVHLPGLGSTPRRYFAASISTNGRYIAFASRLVGWPPPPATRWWP